MYYYGKATENLPAGFWQGLWENADEIIDSTGNMITSWIHAGKGEYPTITVEDDRTKYYAIIAIAIAIPVVLVIILK